MITGSFMKDGQEVLLIGLSRENCERLLADQPIPISAAKLAELGLPTGMEIVIMAGETEAAMSKQLGGMPLQPEVAGQRFLLKGKRP